MDKKFSSYYLIISFVVHAVLVLSFLFAQSFKPVNKRFVVYGAPEKSLAYFRPMRVSKPKASNSRGVSLPSKKKVAPKVEPLKKNLNKPQVKKDLSAPKTVSKSVIKPKPIVESKPVIKKQPNLKPKPVAAKAPKTQASIKPKTPTKPKASTQKTLDTPNKKQDSKKVEQKISEEKKDQVVQPEKLKKVFQAADNSQDDFELGEGEELAFVLGEDVDEKYIGLLNAIQKEISRVWHPPINLPKTCECVVDIIPGFGDVVKSFEIVKPSKIKAFNSSVKVAVPRMKFPKELHGQRLSITFKQW